VPTLFTIHNLAFQGQFPASLFPRLGLPREALATAGLEYFGTVGYLKSGLWFADRISTVSPTYAAEIRTPQAGMGLDGLLRGRGAAVSGILNGLDTVEWDPARDKLLPFRFDAGDLAPRAANKAALQQQLGLAELEARVHGATAANPGRIGSFIGFHEATARLFYAGSDVMMLPSRFEPCGLGQLCALRYGAAPLVARVGGLSDTVIDANEMALAAGWGTGFQFAPVTVELLGATVQRAIALYRDAAGWRRLQQNAMASDVSWRRSAAHYAALFREMIATHG